LTIYLLQVKVNKPLNRVEKKLFNGMKFKNGSKFTMLKTILLCLLFTTSNAFAGLTTLHCAGCTDIQMERTAKYIIRKEGSERVVVMDYMNETAKKYKVFYTTSPRGEPEINAYEQGMTYEELHDVEIIFEYRRAIVDMLKKAKNKIPYGMSSKSTANTSEKDTAYFSAGHIKVKGNPFDFVTTSQFRNNIYDYYISEDASKFDQIISGTLNKVNIPLLKDADISVDIIFIDVVDFLEVPNGSGVITIDFDRKSLELLSLRDKDNNTVPTSVTAARGEYGFRTSESSEVFQTYLLDSFGTGGGDNGGSGCHVTEVESIDGRHSFTFRC
jgi:hypothetical protein